jgi:hypothetical protein
MSFVGCQMSLILVFITQVAAITLLVGTVDIHSNVHTLKTKDRDILSFEEESKNWVNKTVAEAGVEETVHTHILSDITNLNTTTDLPEGINLYYTEDRVSANTDVVNNTAKVSAEGPVSTHSDVNVVGAEDNELLVYDISSGTWVNKTASEVGLVEVGHSHLLSEITDLTTTTDLPEGSKLYYTEERVDTNLSVAANTAKVSADGPISTHIDVDTLGVTNNDLLAYNSVSGKWSGKSIAELGYAVEGHSHTFKRNLLTRDTLFTSVNMASGSYYTMHETPADVILVGNSLVPGSILTIKSSGLIRTTNISDTVSFRVQGLQYQSPFFALSMPPSTFTPYELTITAVVHQIIPFGSLQNRTYVTARFQTNNNYPILTEDLEGVQINTLNVIDLQYSPSSAGISITQSQYSISQLN